MEPINAADTLVILRQTAQYMRRHAPADLDSDDLLQIAQLALLEARARGAEPAASDRRHQENILRQSASYAMLDGIRASFRGAMSGRGRHNDRGIASLDKMEEDGDHISQRSPDDPQRIAELRQAIARLERKGSARLRQCAELLAEGHEAIEVARMMGLSAASVTHYRRKARAIMEGATDLFQSAAG